jgi:D-alanyl-D-alanine carboxypeptidase
MEGVVSPVEDNGSVTHPAEPAAAPTRRATRATAAALRRRRLAAGALVAVVVVVAIGIATLVGSGSPAPTDVVSDRPAAAQSIPAPRFTTVAPAPSICDDPAVAAAVAAGDDDAVVVAAGGGAAFREAVVSGAASGCVSLSDPARQWVVVNKQRPLDPVSYEPQGLVPVQGIRAMNEGILREDAAAALQTMAATIEQSGVGEIGQLSGYRSYDVQVSTFAENVAKGGQAEADISSARPGYSEHQLGITMDLMPCSGGCGTLDDFGSSPEGQWVAENAWQFGFVVRYEEGYTAITGYEAEPWHLRYLGTELARAYHEGAWHTLEEFFGLPAAPGYPG